MVLPHFKRRIRPLTIVLFAAILFMSQSSYGDGKFHELDGIKSGRYFSALNGISSTHTLAPTSLFGPIYSVQRDADGRLYISEPSEEYRESLYTDVVLAFLADSVDNGIAEGPFEEFIQRSVGGDDFEKSRIAKVQRVGESFYASYLKKKDPHEPVVMMLKFSKAPKGVVVNKAKGAIIKLLDGTEILVEAKYLASAPREYSAIDRERMIAVHEVNQLLLQGFAEKAVEVFFTSSALQGKRADVVAEVFNKMLDTAAEGRGNKAASCVFLNAVTRDSVSLIDDAEFSWAIQLMAGQALTIISWMDARIPGADKIRLTADQAAMAFNDKHGRSFVDASSLPVDIVETRKEGAPGFFWRGTERISKLGTNVSEKLTYDKARFEADKDRVVMYLMDHGFYAVTPSLVDATEKGAVSTMHETFFMNDTLPGSFQTTGTGAGHFQETKVDLKRVSEGRGIQFNVRFNAAGNIEEIIAQELKPGAWALALPGCVDYVVNLGGLRFNDFSITLDAGDAAALSPKFDFSNENIAKVKSAVAEKGKVAPYAGVKIGEGSYLLKVRNDAPEIRWIPNLSDFSPEIALIDMYMTLSTPHVKGFAAGIAQSCASTLAEPSPAPAVSMFDEKLLASARKDEAISLGKAAKIGEYLGLSDSVLAKLASRASGDERLIRIPVEAIEAAGAANVKPFLSQLSKAPGAYVELFVSSGMTPVSDARYAEYGVEKRALPPGFKVGRDNTVTLMPILKSEEVSTRGKAGDDWGIGDMRPTETILSPVGFSNDKSGLARGIIMGLRLNEIARQVRKAGKADEEFVRETLGEYQAFCVSQGVRDFSVREIDLINLASGNINRVVEALNNLIKSMPIMPLNAEEIRIIYEHAREALIRA